MRRSIFSASATILGLILFLAAPAVTQAAEITVQPHVLAIQSLGGTVSVHTDIDFSSGSDWTAKINGTLDAYLVKSDLCGNLVAKFDLESVKKMAGDMPVLHVNFTATSPDAGTYSGEDTIIITRKLNRN